MTVKSGQFLDSTLDKIAGRHLLLELAVGHEDIYALIRGNRLFHHVFSPLFLTFRVTSVTVYLVLQALLAKVFQIVQTDLQVVPFSTHQLLCSNVIIN